MIPNILGSGGRAPQALGNLTAGLNALQQTEIGRRLNEIQQNKAWEHDQKVRDEKLMLDAMSKKAVDDMRIGIAQRAAKQVEEFRDNTAKMWQKAQREGRPLSDEDKFAIARGMADIDRQATESKAYADSFEKLQPVYIQTYNSLTGENKEAFARDMAELYSNMQDPTTSLGQKPSDLTMPLRPRETTPQQEIALYMKEKEGLLNRDIYGKGYDQKGTIDALAKDLQGNDYMVGKVSEKLGRQVSPYEAAQYLEESHRPTLKKETGDLYIPQSGDGTKSKFGGYTKEENSQTYMGDKGEAIVLLGETPTIKMVYKGKGEQTGSDVNIEPRKFMNLKGELYMLGKRTVKGNEVDKGVSASEVRRLERIKGLPFKTEKNDDGTFNVVYTHNYTFDAPIPYEDVKEQIRAYYGKDNPDMISEIENLAPVNPLVRQGKSMTERAGVIEPESNQSEQAPSGIPNIITINGSPWTYSQLTKEGGWSDDQIRQYLNRK